MSILRRRRRSRPPTSSRTRNAQLSCSNTSGSANTWPRPTTLKRLSVGHGNRRRIPSSTIPRPPTKVNGTSGIIFSVCSGNYRATSPAIRRANAALEDAIDKSVDTLVAINAAAGQGNATAMQAAHRQAIWSDAIVGAIVLATVTVISVWLLRVVSRQRRLVARAGPLTPRAECRAGGLCRALGPTTCAAP